MDYSPRLDISKLSFILCLMSTPLHMSTPLLTASQILKFPAHSFSKPIATILVHASTNSSSDYWERLISSYISNSFPITVITYDVI